MSLPFASVVVAARDDAEALRDCLASLNSLDYPRERHEVLAVDNASADRTAEVIERFPVTYLYEPRVGVGWARNRGIEAARGEILAFTDPDCVVTTGWLRSLVRPFADPQVGAVAGGIVPYPPRTLPELHAARRRSHTQERSLAHPALPFAMTPSVAYRRSAFEAIGGFDTTFSGGGWEDADLSWRLQRYTALGIAHAPDALVLHRYRDTFRSFFTQQFRYGIGLGILTGKYGAELSGLGPRIGRSLGEIPVAAWRLAPAAGGFALRGDRETLGLRYLDLLRLMAQRTGYVVGRLRRGRT